MNFHCSAVDDLLRHEGDAPTLGLILRQTKDGIVTEPSRAKQIRRRRTRRARWKPRPYELRDVHKPIGVADHELTRALPGELQSSLPGIELVEAELSENDEAVEGEK